MDYAQARLQARFGERPDESVWHRLDAAPEPASVLEIARSTGLRRWVEGITPDSDRHAIEIALRARWRDCVTELSAWMPVSWQPALLWTRGLVDLPALCYLARDEVPLPWMLRDPVLQAYAEADTVARLAMLREDFGALRKSMLGGQDEVQQQGSPLPPQIRDAWLAEWRRRWPRHGDTSALEDLARLFVDALRQSAAPGRPDLTRKLRGLFRRSVLAPAAAFIYVAFTALDIERLRAGLLHPALARARIVGS
jgi:hypothetical protein